MYNRTCTKPFTVLLCTTKLAQSTSQYYFVLQSLHKARTSNTLYDKACTKHVPVLLCATKLAEEAPSTYFVVESLHKALPSTTSYYKACTKHFPVLLRTTKLAQSTSQYYFVLQSLHKVLPSITLYYKACAKHLPVLLKRRFRCGEKLACLRDGRGRRRLCSRTARAVELMVPGDFFSSLMMLCYCVLHVLRHFVHWNCCIEEMRSLLELCNSMSADRTGMAASRFLVFVAANVIVFVFCI